MNSLIKLLLFAAVKMLAIILMLLPMRASLYIGRLFGVIAYHVLARKRKVVYANLKTVFAQTHSPLQLRQMTRDVFINFNMNCAEFLTLPKMKKIGFEKFVVLEGKEHIAKGLAGGRGVIFLAMHSGSWELASIVGALTNSAYYLVANAQSKNPPLEAMLNEYRALTGSHLIEPGVSTKAIIKALRANGIISLVLDQGGKEGLVVPFLGKSASMSTGAIRLGLKYGAAVCPVWIERQAQGHHLLKVFEPLPLNTTHDSNKDIDTYVRQAAGIFESLLNKSPEGYLWFYKFFKYSDRRHVLIIDDGRTGHLRQSQAVSSQLRDLFKKKNIIVTETIVTIQWRHDKAKLLFSGYAGIAQFLPFLQNEDCLKDFLTDATYADLMSYKADVIISCGSTGAGINFILSQNHLAQSISILTPGLLRHECFKLTILPAHDMKEKVNHPGLIITKAAPNLITPAYLKDQAEALMRHYSHLKGNVRRKIGVLIGGNTKGVVFEVNQIEKLMAQIKDAASHYNADILLTTSRRTPIEVERAIAGALKGFNRVGLCIIANQHNLPEVFGGILGLSDLLIVSGESISMVSEAISSAKPTIVFSPLGKYEEKPRDKYENFVLKLSEQGYLMVSSVDDIKYKITQILSQKITLKVLDDRLVIQQGLQTII